MNCDPESGDSERNLGRLLWAAAQPPCSVPRWQLTPAHQPSGPPHFLASVIHYHFPSSPLLPSVRGDLLPATTSTGRRSCPLAASSSSPWLSPGWARDHQIAFKIPYMHGQLLLHAHARR